MEKGAEQEVRHFTRVEFSTRAEVEINDVTMTGELVDISISAMYVRGNIQASVGDHCEVRLFLGDEDPMIIHGVGHVVRHDVLGVAISFSGFYCDSVPNLKQLVMLKSEDRKRVKAKLRDHPEITDT